MIISNKKTTGIIGSPKYSFNPNEIIITRVMMIKPVKNNALEIFISFLYSPLNADNSSASHLILVF